MPWGWLDKSDASHQSYKSSLMFSWKKPYLEETEEASKEEAYIATKIS